MPDTKEILIWGISLLSGIRAVNTAYLWRATKKAQPVQDKLAAGQRKLLGLPPSAPKPTEPMVGQRKPVLPPPQQAGGATPISTPQRYPPAPYAATPASGGWGEGAPAMDWQRTPLTGSTGFTRPSPRSAFSTGLGAATVATPQQLQSFLDRLAPDSQAPPPTTPGGYLGTPGYGGGGEFEFTPGSAYGAGYGDYGGGSYGAMGMDAHDGAPSPALPVGDIPKYRSSWLPRAQGEGGAVPMQSEALNASTEDEAAQFLWGVLRAKREWMEVWTERLREWLSSRVVQPLLVAVEGAHTAPNAILAKYGQQARLPPLPSLICGTAAAQQGGAGLGGVGAAGLGSGAGGVEGEALLRQLQQLCQAMYNPANPAQAQDALALAAGLIKYEQLLLILRGRRPNDLLPPVPSAYIWTRITALAQGTCLPAFNWNGGGPWGGRGWSPDLPNDSLLVLYLFCAFLDAPGWQFDSPGPMAGAGGDDSGAGRGMPLFLGTLKTRPPQQYSAVLAYRPDKPGKGVDAILALHGNSTAGTGSAAGSGGGGAAIMGAGGPGSTLFCFLAEGRLLALSGYNAVFHALIAFLLYHQSKYNGALGRHYLADAALSLSAVIEPPTPGANTAPRHSVWGWWFPPMHTAGGGQHAKTD